MHVCMHVYACMHVCNIYIYVCIFPLQVVSALPQLNKLRLRHCTELISVESLRGAAELRELNLYLST